jgi:hypothetical protein
MIEHPRIAPPALKASPLPAPVTDWRPGRQPKRQTRVNRNVHREASHRAAVIRNLPDSATTLSGMSVNSRKTLPRLATFANRLRFG